MINFKNVKNKLNFNQMKKFPNNFINAWTKM